MPPKEELKSKVCQEIDRRSDEIVEMVKIIWKNPELGYKEVKTSRLVAQKFSEMGIPYRDGLAVTGVRGVVQGGSAGPTVAVLGELDSVIVRDHPDADPETGAVHACGHHLQIGHVIGVAAGLTGSSVLPSLSGRVAFMAVPPEEPLQFEFRNSLRKQGKVTFWLGKQELIKLGEFDDIDIAMMTHGAEGGKLGMGVGPAEGAMRFKYVEFLRGTRAGDTGWVNTQYAATIALSAIDAQREIFEYKYGDDHITVKAVITKAGDTAENIPDEIGMEIFLGANQQEPLKDVSEMVDQALRAGAQAVGAKARITTMAGFLPLIRDPILQELYRADAVSLVGEKEMFEKPSRTMTDMGDVSNVMRSGSYYCGGFTASRGRGTHPHDYQVVDYEAAVILPAKAMAMLVVDLLADGAVKGKEVLSRSKPQMTKQEYLALQAAMITEEEYEG